MAARQSIASGALGPVYINETVSTESIAGPGVYVDQTAGITTVNATLSVTLDATTLVATASVSINAALSVTLDNTTLLATATVTGSPMRPTFRDPWWTAHPGWREQQEAPKRRDLVAEAINEILMEAAALHQPAPSKKEIVSQLWGHLNSFIPNPEMSRRDMIALVDEVIGQERRRVREMQDEEDEELLLLVH